MSALRVLIVLGVSFLASTGARAEPFRCSNRGGAEWRTYRSKHFVVSTDASRPTAAAMVADLERLHALEVKALLGEVVDIPGRVQVIAFADPGQFGAYARHEDENSYATVSQLGEQTIVFPVVGLQAKGESIAFQIAENLSWYLFPRQPAWFRAGLGMFARTVAADVDLSRRAGSNVQVGERSPKRAAGLATRAILTSLERAPFVPSRELLLWNGDYGDDATWWRWNLASWLLYHWLWNTRSKDLSAFQERLAAAEEPAAAWRATFPDLSPAADAAMARLDGALDRYRRDGRYAYYTVSAEGDASFEEAPLPPADLHARLLGVRHGFKGDRASLEAAREEVDEALRDDPAQPLAVLWRAERDGAPAAAALRDATAARPRDARAWFLLAQQLDERGASEKEAALRKAVALDPDLAVAQNALAWLLVGSGRAREALPFANWAVDLAPWNPRIVDTLAGAAAGVGKCKEAAVLERRAIALVPERSAEAGRMRKRLEDYEQHCGASAKR